MDILIYIAYLYLWSFSIAIFMFSISSLRRMRNTASRADDTRLNYASELQDVFLKGTWSDRVFVPIVMPVIAWYMIFP